MALTPTEQTQIQAIITREGGASAFVNEVQAMLIANMDSAAVTTLAAVISVTVTDWTAISSYVAQASSMNLYSVAAQIDAAVAAKSATNLGPLFVALYASTKTHFGV